MTEKIENQPMDYILYMLLALIFAAPLFRGLFFDTELTVVHMYTAVVAVLYFWLNREQIRFSKNITDYAGMGLILAYTISFFVAWNTRDAIGEVLKVLNYFLVFWLVAKTTNNFQSRRKVIWTLYMSGVVVAFIGIGSAFGTFTYNGAFSEGLINSTLQYHNAGAIYMIAAGILGLYLTISVDDLKDKIIVAIGNYVIFITAMGAGSRGAILVTPIALFVQFIGLQKEDKRKYCLACLAVLVPFALTAKWVLAFSELVAAALWAMLFLGIIVAAGTQYLLGKVNFAGINFKKSWLYAAALVILIVFGGLYIVKGTAILPERITSRIANISLKEYNTQERTFFYKDAIKMIKDKPILGYGGGGWNAAFRSYQSYLYNSSEVHSHPLQVWIEAGVLGFLSYVALWLGVILSAVKIMRKRREYQACDDLTMSWTAFAAAIALGLHSLIDFSLSLGALMIFLWTLFGVIRSTDEQFSDPQDYYFKPGFNYRYRLLFGTLLMFLFFVTGACFWLGDKVAQQAYADLEQGNIEEGVNKIETATRLDPFNGEMFFNKGMIYSQIMSMDPRSPYQDRMIESARAAVERRKGDPAGRLLLARCLLTANDIEQAVVTAEEAVSYSPLMPVAYEELADVYVKAAKKYRQQGNADKATEVANKTLMIPDRLTAIWNGLNQDEKRMYQGDPLNKISDKLKMQLYTARGQIR